MTKHAELSAESLLKQAPGGKLDAAALHDEIASPLQLGAGQAV